VKVPQIDASSNSDSISMYWGNAGAADDQNGAAVWGNSYAGSGILTATLMTAPA
jgi:hypothetical protein